MTQEKLSTIPIIRLDDAGALFQCQLPFLAGFQGGGYPGSYKLITVSEGDFVMYLGIRHFQSRRNEFQEKKSSNIRKMKPEVFRARLKSELFHGAYNTSLNFLWKEKIVKVTWHGRWGLDQLTEAAAFMYLHFLVPEDLRKENK